MTEEYLTWVEVKKDALRHNLALFKKIIGPQVKLMPVVKSNAYGHGILEATKVAIDFGVDYIGVVNLDEALLLRKNGIVTPVLVLSYFDSSQIEEAIKTEVELVVYNEERVKLISQAAQKLKKTARIHIKIDTGTSRLGVLTKEAAPFINKIKDLRGIELTGIFTHFADSENDNWTYTNKQLSEFKNLLFELQKANIKIPLAHTACSAAAMSSAETHFDLVRVGISFYGLWPSEENKKAVQKKFPWFELKPALAWKTRIIQIKELAKGTPVGYGCTYKTKQKTTIAILPVGYNEGYDRLLSNKGKVIVKKKKVPVLGRVCMNLTMIDVTDLEEVTVGEEVVLIGKQGNQQITADEIAALIKTINYEVVTRINPQIPKIYL